MSDSWAIVCCPWLTQRENTVHEGLWLMGLESQTPAIEGRLLFLNCLTLGPTTALPLPQEAKIFSLFGNTTTHEEQIRELQVCCESGHLSWLLIEEMSIPVGRSLLAPGRTMCLQ